MEKGYAGAAHDFANVRLAGRSMPDIPALNAFAVRSLLSLFDEREHLFSQRAMLRGGVLRRDRTSRRHSLIALLGLQRLASAGEAPPFDIAVICDAVLKDISWVKSVGDLGLLTWLMAICCPDRLRQALDELDFDRALSIYPDGREGYTTGLAWFLTGIAHARLASPAVAHRFTDVAVDAYRMLQNNQSQQGIFGHAGAARFPKGASYSRLGTFTDQICAIYALSVFAHAFQVDEPLESALACANSVCALQGDLGQWWFLYDKRTGMVLDRYPVLALHQYGTAPCALWALGQVTGRNFDDAILKGVSWIMGANELSSDLRNLDPTFIWDSIRARGSLARYWTVIKGLLGPSPGAAKNDLKIRHESRSDHLGWLLYALGEFGLPKQQVECS